MPGLVEIANLTLSLIGAEPIDSIDDPEKSARLFKANWPTVRDAVLRAYPWKCAIKRAELAPLVETPLFDWGYAFPLPEDCLRVLGVEHGDSDDVRYSVEGGSLMYDESVVRIKYIARIKDPNQFDSTLVSAFSCYMGSVLAHSIVQSSTLAQDLLERYKLFVKEARSVDSQEQSMTILAADQWVASRGRANFWRSNR